MKRDEIIDTAKGLINGERRDDYGDASESFEQIALGWSVILGAELTREQVALCMIWLKMMRAKQTPGHTDSWVDIVGYAGLGGEMGTRPAALHRNWLDQEIRLRPRCGALQGGVLEKSPRCLLELGHVGPHDFDVFEP